MRSRPWRLDLARKKKLKLKRQCSGWYNVDESNPVGSAEIDTQACLATLDAGNREGGIELFADDQNDGGREPNG